MEGREGRREERVGDREGGREEEKGMAGDEERTQLTLEILGEIASLQ